VAAEQAGVPRRSIYNQRARDETFAAAWDEALVAGVDALEEEARRRAVDGFEERTIIRRADGTVEERVTRKYSDGLLTRLLEARTPERWGARQSVRVDLDVGPPRLLPEEEAVQVLAVLRQIGALPSGPEVVDGEAIEVGGGEASLG
jgi:hypothetical protein